MINAPITRIREVNAGGATGVIFTAAKKCLVNITCRAGFAGSFYRNSINFNNLIFDFDSGGSPSSNARTGTTLLEVGETIFSADASATSNILTILEIE